ncbi:MAG: prepilin-type N-terminal cleavage/methylation domain-containing protein [Actinobacteria bacterium]|nr:prepilin-type N-terminal cleavage/methylation domain-containing protein [Actinomycetota bacterium]
MRRPTREEGFSLVELLVITLIIGILAGIAITTYIRQTQKAERAAAISTLSNMRLAAESIRANAATDSFSGDPAAYDTEQGSYDYEPGASPSTGSNVVSVHAPPDGTWVSFAVRGKGQCFYLRIEATSDVLYQSTSDMADVACDALEFTSGLGTGAWG